MFPIRITVNNKIKAVQFWLTAQEGEDKKVADTIKAYADEFTQAVKKADRYKKVVYISGTAPLVSATADLLKRNR